LLVQIKKILDFKICHRKRIEGDFKRTHNSSLV